MKPEHTYIGAAPPSVRVPSKVCKRQNDACEDVVCLRMGAREHAPRVFFRCTRCVLRGVNVCVFVKCL